MKYSNVLHPQLIYNPTLPVSVISHGFDGWRAISLPTAFSAIQGGNQEEEVATSNARPLSAHSPGPNEPFLFMIIPFPSL